jgi:fatty-acid desaturase
VNSNSTHLDEENETTSTVVEADGASAPRRLGAFVGPATSKYPIPRPERTKPVRVLKPYAIGIPVVHVLCLLAFLPYFFSWTGVVLAIAGHYFFGLLGMTLGYHRLLTHRGFTCPKWFEHMLALLGVCCLQDSPARWVAVHRKHHQYSDEQPDPHSPHVTFMWGHFGWLMLRNDELSTTAFYDRYARDLMAEKFYRRLEMHAVWVLVYMLHALLFIVAGFAVGWFTTRTLDEAIRLSASYLVWGVFVRTVFVWHVTWAVNSVAHLFGYRNYETTDDSRNNWLVALLAHGEGWHNNHHAEPRAASHGHRSWELDPTWITIRALEAVGLVKNVVRPKSWRTK